jgi:hypothetical protein
MPWYKQEDFFTKTNEFFEWLISDTFFFGSSSLLKDHFISLDLDIDCTSWKYKQVSNKRLTISIINKDASVQLLRVISTDNKIEYIYSSLDVDDFIRFIDRFKQECDNYFIKRNQRIIEERTNQYKFEEQVRTQFLSKFLSS